MADGAILASADGHALVRLPDPSPQRFEPETSYISIAVRRVSLKKGRSSLSRYGPYLFGVLGQTNFDAQTALAGVFAPAVERQFLAGASAHEGSQIGAPTTIAAPEFGTPGPMQAESFKRLDRVLMIDRQLTPRLVYRGEGPIQLGFGGVLQKDYLADSLGVLEAVVKSPVAQFVSSTAPAIGHVASALDIASTIRAAFDQLADRKGMQRLALLDIDLRVLFDSTGAPPAGLYALIAKEDVPDNLEVDREAGGRLMRGGRPYLAAPYVVFELRREDTRPDWGRVPDVNRAWRTLESQVLSGDTLGALQAFRRSVYICPDLVPADSERIYLAAKRKLGPLLASTEAFGLPKSLGTVAQALKQTYDALIDQPVVQGMRDEWALFLKCHDIMRVNEGGFVDHPDDPGGATNMGVTQRTYDEWREGQRKTRRSVRDITEAEVQQIYFEGYWRAGQCEKMPSDAAALVLFDACVNHGPKQAMKFMQRGANMPSSQIDGAYGPMTADAIGSVDPVLLVRRALDARWSFFQRIMERNPRLESFRNGWRRRVDHMRQLAHAWASGQESAVSDLPLLAPQDLASPVFARTEETG